MPFSDWLKLAIEAAGVLFFSGVMWTRIGQATRSITQLNTEIANMRTEFAEALRELRGEMVRTNERLGDKLNDHGERIGTLEGKSGR
jgi:hypothetical protein